MARQNGLPLVIYLSPLLGVRVQADAFWRGPAGLRRSPRWTTFTEPWVTFKDKEHHHYSLTCFPLTFKYCRQD